MHRVINPLIIVLGLASPACLNAMKEQPATQPKENKRTHQLIALQQFKSVHPDTRGVLKIESERAKKVQVEPV